jgi:hypothetical protein
MKKYQSIDRINKSRNAYHLNKSNVITIEEKLDGANASFLLNEEDELKIFSRNNELDPINNSLNGFYPYMENHLKDKRHLLNPRYIYFGEWLIPHKIKYIEYKKYYLFDVFDIVEGIYLPYEVVQEEAQRLSIDLVPLLYYGHFIDYDHLISFVGQSNLTTEPNTGEGIIVKFIDQHGNRVAFKVVSEKFAERKIKKPETKFDETPEGHFVLECVTQNRVEKIIMKLQDENLLDGELVFENMRNLIKQITPLVYEDVVKEEGDDIDPTWNLGKAVSKVVPVVLKDILNAYYL